MMMKKKTGGLLIRWKGKRKEAEEEVEIDGGIFGSKMQTDRKKRRLLEGWIDRFIRKRAVIEDGEERIGIHFYADGRFVGLLFS